VLSITAYGILLVGLLTLNDGETTKMVLNIVNHVINGLFTFAAVLNLPVRIVRLKRLFMNRNNSVVRKITIISNFFELERTTTEQDQAASQLIFDHLAWGTQHMILQALLWNSLFQIINQVFRCVYYSYEMTAKLPGKIWVNTFFPLALLASILAALIQAVAENRFLRENSLNKKQSNCKKNLVEFWHNLWKVQTEGEMALARKFDNHVPGLVRNSILDLDPRLLEEFIDYSGSLEELQEFDEKPNADSISIEQELDHKRERQRFKESNLGVHFLYLGCTSEKRSKIYDLDKELVRRQNNKMLSEQSKSGHDAVTEMTTIITLNSPISFGKRVVL